MDKLLQLVDFYRPAPSYKAVAIDATYGHAVFYTPPYHPTFQSIGLIWGTVKNRIAMAPAKNGKDVAAKVVEELEECSEDWMKVYRHVQERRTRWLGHRSLELYSRIKG
ncbi:hypothetical protein F442_06228 [Phytophthora nicotianae P10297]|uniref:Tc1-like transposase DDE domain-containing protein n=3 Tax=Phytophthora nicotianae TaxID=4792 RepID=W2ZP23_PHYNI|nr:hypothetical protein L914_06011 [Phytophthora nicotianae]ETP47969.1 hypothetical protein F442_06228 [Phytophthora nicotianae P10297]